MIGRRPFLALLGSTALTACGTTGNTPTPSVNTIASDVNILAGGIAGVAGQLSTMTIPGLTPAVLSKVEAAATTLQGLAQQIAAAPSNTAALPLIQQVETYVNIVVDTLAVIPLIPPPISTALQAAAVLLPIIEAAVGMISTKAAVAAPTMSPDQARMILLGQSANKVLLKK